MSFPQGPRPRRRPAAMSPPADQVLTCAQMRAGEAALIAAGTTIDALMRRAGEGAAEWIWRMAGGGKVSVLCGSGNNGCDGWVIAEAIRARGGAVSVIAAADPTTPAAKAARGRYQGEVLGSNAETEGRVLVDCLLGSGLTRPLSAEHLFLLERLAARHERLVAVDLPSGIDADLGRRLSDDDDEAADLLAYDLTIALGAWKFAHFLQPAATRMGMLKLIDLGLEPCSGAAQLLGQPRFNPPPAACHKYSRGLLGVVTGPVPGAAVLAACAAQGAGAGYIRLLGKPDCLVPSSLVVDGQWRSDAPFDHRLSALLIGPGLGRDDAARLALRSALLNPLPVVFDADALHLIGPDSMRHRKGASIATPHEGEMQTLENAWGLDGSGSKADRAAALARASGMVVVAKGADTVVAASDGRLALARPASSWLSTAGTGDVLAGIIASRLATRAEPFAAACEGVWLHGEAARRCGPIFTAARLAETVHEAYAACL